MDVFKDVELQIKAMSTFFGETQVKVLKAFEFSSNFFFKNISLKNVRV